MWCPKRGEKLMNKSEILAGLKDLVEDRESFIEPDDPDSIFVQDKAVLQAAIRVIRRYAPEKEAKS